MSQNIQQIFVANPASSMVSTDLLYLGRSPYGPTDDFAITFANFVASIGTATPTASTIPRWDAHVNMSANNFLAGFASTATAAATTTLTVSSAYNQYFTGTTTQTVVLPVTSTLALGFPFRIINNSTGVVTVQSSGANTIQAMAPGSTLLLTCILISGTTAASWDAQYIIATDVSGAVLLSPAAAQTILTYPLNVPGGIYTPQIFDSNGNGLITLTTTTSAVNLLNIKNAATGTGPILSAAGSDTNIALGFSSKGTGIMAFTAANVANQFQFYTYTAGACENIFNFPGTTGTITYTFPAVSGTLALAAASAQTFDGDTGTATPSAGVITFTGGATGLTFAGSGSTLTLGGTAAIAHGGTGVTSVTIAPTASAFAAWDANSNISMNNLLPGYTTTATAAGSTTLTIASTYYQFWTGVTTQTVLLPHTSTVVGTSYYFVNNSTGNVTVEASGGQSVQVMAGGSSALFTCISAAGTTAASWNVQYFVDSDVSGAVLLSPAGVQTITTYGLVLPSVNFSTTSGIIGTTTNDNAAAGSVGQLISSVIAIGSAISISSGVSSDITSISLTAGDWDVWGNVGFIGGATTNVSFTLGWINTVSATPPDASLYCGINYGATGLVIFGNGVQTGFTVPSYRLSLSGTTTVYLTVDASFSISTCTAFGGIYARRRR